MPDSSNAAPWLAAWIDLQRQLVPQLPEAPRDEDDALRRLCGVGGEYVGIAGDWWRLFAAPGASARAATPAAHIEAMRALFSHRYQQFFMPEIARAPVTTQRWQAAAQRFAQQVAAVANDASRRLSAALMADDAGLPPITSLRQLHELWVNCGEAAWAAAAHGDEFAEAQAELLAAWVESVAAARRAPP